MSLLRQGSNFQTTTGGSEQKERKEKKSKLVGMVGDELAGTKSSGVNCGSD